MGIYIYIFLRCLTYLRGHLTYINFKLSKYLLVLLVLLFLFIYFGFGGGLLKLLVIISCVVLFMHIGISLIHIVKDYVYIQDVSIYSRYIVIYSLLNLFLYFIII